MSSIATEFGKLDTIAPLTHDVYLADGIGWRTVLDVTTDTVTVNGSVGPETWPRSMVRNAYRRPHPATAR